MLVHWYPFLQHIDTPRHHDPTITFIGLAEAYLLFALHRARIPFPRIHSAVEVRTAPLAGKHALASHRIYSETATFFEQWNHSPCFIPYSHPSAFREALHESERLIVWGKDDYPLRLYLPTYHPTKVLIDPEHAFGQPIFASTGTKVDDVLERFWAGDPLQSIALDYGLDASDVEEALRVASRQGSRLMA